MIMASLGIELASRAYFLHSSGRGSVAPAPRNARDICYKKAGCGFEGLSSSISHRLETSSLPSTPALPPTDSPPFLSPHTSLLLHHINPPHRPLKRSTTTRMRASLLALLLPSTLALPTLTLPTLPIISTLLAGPSLPASSLPQPASGLTLKYIALGLGTQNYTCASSTADTTPFAVGATATLYDATGSMSVPVAGKIAQDSLTCSADHLNSDMGLPRLGTHFFSAAGVPSFNLSAVGLFLSSKKVATAAPPTDACAGRDSGVAVAWLNLLDRDDGVSHGLSAVYRVKTTGGSAPATCEGMSALVERDYAAEYWFYG